MAGLRKITTWRGAGAAKLKHPNIVTAYDAGEHEDLHYLVMEYVEGEDLAPIVTRQGPLPVAQAVDCIVQAARGLSSPPARGDPSRHQAGQPAAGRRGR